MRPTQVSQLLQIAIAQRLPALLVGQPGIGKTALVKQAAGATSSDLIIMHPAVSDPTDFKGLPAPDGAGAATFLPFGELQQLISASSPTVAFLDDLGQAPASVQAAAMQLILERRVNGHKVSDHVTFMAATNRASDKAGVTGILEPVKSRFAFIAEVDIDPDEWVKWAIANNLPYEAIAFVRFRPAYLSAWKPEREIKAQPCPRTFEFLARTLGASVPAAIEFDTFKSIVGEACAAEFLGFLKHCRQLPDPDSILLNPSGAQVPAEPSALHAVSSLLVQKSNVGNFDNVITYMNRLPKEFQVSFFKDLHGTDKGKELVNTKAFVKWASDNANVIF